MGHTHDGLAGRVRDLWVSKHTNKQTEKEQDRVREVYAKSHDRCEIDLEDTVALNESQQQLSRSACQSLQRDACLL